MVKKLPEPKGVLKEFLDFQEKESTSRSYRSHLRCFFDIVNSDPDQYINSNRDFGKDIIKFATAIKGKPPLSKKAMISAIKNFFLYSNITIEPRVWMLVRNGKKGAKPLTENVRPTNPQLELILSHGNAKDRALYTLIAHSGMRIDETLLITFDDIDMENREIHLSAEITKTDSTCIAYFTPEAKKRLETWFKVREQFLRSNYQRSKYIRDKLESDGYQIKKERVGTNLKWVFYKNGELVSEDDLVAMEKRIFPISVATARDVWNGLLEKTGAPLNTKTKDERLKHNRYKYHIHTLRKFFSQNMENDGVPRSYIDTWTNHSQPYNGAYAPITKEEAKAMYEKHMNCLAIFSDLDSIHKEIKPKIEAQDTAIRGLMEENRQLKSTISDMQKTLEALNIAIGNNLNDMLVKKEAKDKVRDEMEKEAGEQKGTTGQSL